MTDRKEAFDCLRTIEMFLRSSGEFWHADHLDKAIELLEKQEPQKKGYWKNPRFIDCECSECGNQPEHEPGSEVPLYPYCPYCGAKMAVIMDD